MRMRRLIWICAGRKGLIIPKVFSKFPHSDPPKLGQFPCFLKIFTNAALFPEYIWVLPRSKENPGSPIRARNMGLNNAPYEKVPDSSAQSTPAT